MLQIIPSTIRPLSEPWPEEGLTVDGCTIHIHIGGGQGVTVGLTVEAAWLVGQALSAAAVSSCELSWRPPVGSA